MGVTSFTHETTSSVAPARLFKAVVLDAKNIIPKLFPDVTSSIDVTPGEGGAPTIVKINYTNGKCHKHRFDTVDKDNFYCEYTLIEGDELANGVESVVVKNKFEASSDGGSLCKRTVDVHAADGVNVSEVSIKEKQETAGKVFKGIEAYLVENPTAYA